MNALNKKMGVTYYREIKQDQFDTAEIYLKQWAGRLKRGLKRTDEDEHEQSVKNNFCTCKESIRMDKRGMDGYIYECYEKESIRDLTKRNWSNFIIKYLR
jgi:hypothetical protein